MQKIGLIAVDMDGTLLNSRREISVENLKALKEARSAGIALAICSGRTPGDLYAYVKECELDNLFVICLNGTYCCESLDAEPIGDHVLDPQLVRKIEAIGKANALSYGLHSANHVAITPGTPGVLPSYFITHTSGDPSPRITFDDEGLAQARKRGVNKVVLIGSDENRLSAAREAFRLLPSLDVSTTWSDNIELMPSGCNKGTALSELAQKLGLTREQVMAIGDYDNDVSMIAYAGIGVAMGNATDLIRNAANVSVPDNDNDGVAYAIRHYAL